MYLLALGILLFCIVSGTLFIKDFESWTEEKKNSKASWWQMFTLTLWLFLYLGSILYLVGGLIHLIMN